MPRLHIFAPNAAHVSGEESVWGGASLLSFSADPERAKVDKSAREGPPGTARRVPSIFQAQLGRVAALQSSLENSSAGFLERTNIPSDIPGVWRAAIGAALKGF